MENGDKLRRFLKNGAQLKQAINPVNNLGVQIANKGFAFFFGDGPKLESQQTSQIGQCNALASIGRH